MPELMYEGGGSTPIPDPTALTTAAVRVATDQVRRDMESMQHLIEARLNGMDNATTLRLKVIDEIPAATAMLVSNLEQLQNERFNGIALQFKERDIRTDQAAIASKQALDAALLAAKELVGQQNTANVEAAAKAETSFTKQIDQTSVLIATLEKALTDRILELKERMDRGEGSVAGAHDTQSGYRSNTSMAIAAFVGFLLLISTALSVALALKP